MNESEPALNIKRIIDSDYVQSRVFTNVYTFPVLAVEPLDRSSSSKSDVRALVPSYSITINNIYCMYRGT